VKTVSTEEKLTRGTHLERWIGNLDLVVVREVEGFEEHKVVL